MSMRASIVYGVGDWLDTMRSHAIPVGQAATAAIRSAALRIKAEGRADIAAAGFSQKWQNAFRVDVYPRGKSYSINAAAWVYHKIPYAGVFEKGATIRGKPLMWIPLPNAPKKVGRERISAARLIDAGVQLSMRKSKRGKPMLWANMSVTDGGEGVNRKVTLAQLKAGKSGRGKKGRTTVAVPLFVGVSAVKLKKKFNINGVVERAASQLARHYFNAFTGGG